LRPSNGWKLRRVGGVWHSTIAMQWRSRLITVTFSGLSCKGNSRLQYKAPNGELSRIAMTILFAPCPLLRSSVLECVRGRVKVPIGGQL
jgi:hypothetical protein